MSRYLKVYQQVDKGMHAAHNKTLSELSRQHRHNYGTRICARKIFYAGIADQWRFCCETLKWVSNTTEGHSFSFCVTDSKAKNAWAFRDALGKGHHLIVATASCLRSMQSVAEVVAETLFRNPSPREDTTLYRLLGQRLDEETIVSVAQVVGMATTLFLLFHEAAHILRGHHFASAADVARGESRGIPTFARPMAANVFHGHVRSPSVVSKTKEFDADLHAFLWSRLYFDNNRPDALGALGEASRRTHLALLCSAEGRRYVTLIGAMCFHLNLSGSADHSALNEGSHPSRHDRVQLTYLADYALQAQSAHRASFLPECIRFSSALVVTDSIRGGTLFPRIADQIKGASGDSNLAMLKIATQWLGNFEDEQGLDEVHHRRMHLINAMQRLAPQLTRHGISTKLPVFQWWAM